MGIASTNNYAKGIILGQKEILVGGTIIQMLKKESVSTIRAPWISRVVIKRGNIDSRI